MLVPAEVNASVRRICQGAELPKNQALVELLQILRRAERHHSNCRLTDFFLIWKSVSGNLERRFRRFQEIHTPQRAQLLDTTLENCMLVEQAPPSKMLRTLQFSSSGASASLD